MRKIFAFLCLGLVALYAKGQVSVSILPQQYFVKQIAGDAVEVNVMVGKGADPHTYAPKPKQMTALEKSDLYFAIGIEFEEAWLPKFQKSYPNLKIVKTDEGVEKIKFEGHNEHADHDHHHDAKHEHADHDHHHDAKHEHKHEHSHHDHKHEHAGHDHHDHDHHHGEFDPHIWLDPVLVKIQAKNIAAALSEKYPENKALFEANLAKFEARLDELDGFIKNTLANVKNREFIVYHPSWGYFAKRYDLEQIAIEVDGKEPKPAELKELIEEAKEHGVKVIFVAPQFSKKAAQTVAKESGASVVEIDQLPLDWDAELRKTAQIFAKSL